MAAPMATTSSGLTPLWGSLPARLRAISMILGMRVMPPTRTSSSTWAILSSASLRQDSNGRRVRSERSSQTFSIWARVSVTFRCFGPEASAVMNGRLMSTEFEDERAILAFSASSLRRWRAMASLERSMPVSVLKPSMSHWMMRSSQLSPPSSVSPLVAFTSKTPPPISRTETSKVPPPRS